ncbi:MAG: alpha/beta hydrolase-fold protein [Saprospiraceae bacterium]
MIRIVLTSMLLTACFSMACNAQSASLHAEWQKLKTISNIQDETQRTQQLDRLWNEWQTQHKIPLAVGDSVIFLYRGEAETVAFGGDWNFFQPTPAQQLANTDVWYWKNRFPADARIDYKIILNGTNYILDSANIYKQYSGYNGGQYNSELRMPQFKPEKWAEAQSNITKGKLNEPTLIKSKVLDYDIQYQVYLPNGYAQLKNLPVFYVTDGQEYSDARMGSMVTTIDNLLASKQIKPLILVFVDPREPGNPNNNRRESEFLTNEKFLQFFKQELIPTIDKQFKTSTKAADRGILGTSFGGVNSTYFMLKASDTFGMIGINSPAYWIRMSLIEDIIRSPRLPVKVFLSTGAVSDGEEIARIVRTALQDKGYPLQYIEVNQGHSWGQWRTLMDDLLLYFFAKEAVK